MQKSHVLAGAALAALCSAASAVVINETEPNDTKAAANAAVLTAVGDSIVGMSTGTSTTVPGVGSADNFRVTSPAQVQAIYRNRLTITTQGTAGHTGTIRGLGQSATGLNSTGPGTFSTALDNTAQTSSATSTPPRFNQWYTFGAPADIYYRVTGATATTADYTSTYSQDVVVPVPIGVFGPGSYTFTNTGLTSTQDTEVFVYNSALQPVPGALNDDFLDGTPVPPGGSTLNSLLTRNLSVGTYYLAISNFNTADNQLSPADEGTANGTILDFPGAMTNSSTTVLASIPFSLVHPGGTVALTASKPGPFDIWWGTFTVVPEPTTLALTVLALPALLRRRK